MITVYSKPNCPHCVATKKFLETKGADHKVIDLIEEPEYMDLMTEKGFRTVPVVNFEDQWWTGFDVIKLTKAVS